MKAEKHGWYDGKVNMPDLLHRLKQDKHGAPIEMRVADRAIGLYKQAIPAGAAEDCVVYWRDLRRAIAEAVRELMLAEPQGG